MQNQQQQQQQQMSCGGGVGVGGGGLSRFRSAPATWFDNLLQVQEDEEPQNQNLPQLPNLRNSASYDPTTLFESTNFTRHNSSPPELLAHLTSSSTTLPSDGYFSSSDYDLLSILDIPTTSKRSRESESTIQSKIEHSSDFSNMEMDNLFPDSVPCRVRAKRGCATHPRSIAERVRRTRISDRIRKLQELVPNMDKQTNTADMLDEAVEYVKYLQKQIQELSEHQKNCTCISRD